MTDEIRNWFVEHENGEFVAALQDHPYLVVPGAAS